MSTDNHNPQKSTTAADSKTERWLRDHSGTYECRIRKKSVYRIRIASHGVSVKKVLILLGHRQDKPRIELVLEIQCKARKVSIRVPWEVLADERAFLAVCPVGFCLTTAQKAFALLRECLSSDVQSCPWEAVLEATGWFQFQEKFVFAHAGGVIGSENQADRAGANLNNGTAQAFGIVDVKSLCSDVPILTDAITEVTEVHVELPPNLRRYRLPQADSPEELRTAVGKVLELFSLGNENVTYLTIPAIFATAIHDPRYALFLHGPSGSLKTHFALLLLSFFVPDAQEEDAASFKSTENALRAEFSSSGTVPVVVDDYIQFPNARGGGEEARKADGLVRSVVNKTGKKRSKSNGDLQVGPKPRGLPIITGEILPDGLDSLQKRCINCLIDETAFSEAIQGQRPNRFDDFQQLAREGVFAKAMAGFLAWAAADLIEHKQYVKQGDAGGQDDIKLHGRQKDAARTIVSGMVLLLDFAKSVGACTDEAYESHAEKIVEVVNNWQRQEYLANMTNLPTEKYATLLLDALRSRKCHLEVRNVDLDYYFDESGIPCELIGYSRHREPIPAATAQSPSNQTHPESAANNSDSEGKANGAANGSNDQESDDSTDEQEPQWKTIYRPHGTKIGDIGFEEIRINCSESLGVANELGARIGVDRLPPPKQFGKLLARDGWLEKTQHDRNCYKVRMGKKKVIDAWVFAVDRFFEPALDWDDFDIAYYKELNELERMKARAAVREKHFSKRRSAVTTLQIDTILNPHLSEEDRQALRGEAVSPQDVRAGNRREFQPPKCPREPGYDDTTGLDLDV